MMKSRMEELQGLLQSGEVVQEVLYNGCYSWDYVITDGSDDLGGAIENTLHRLLEAEIEPYEFGFVNYEELEDMGLTEEEIEESYIWIDLGYMIPLVMDLGCVVAE